jgi:hypothetical protein
MTMILNTVLKPTKTSLDITAIWKVLGIEDFEIEVEYQAETLETWDSTRILISLNKKPPA